MEIEMILITENSSTILRDEKINLLIRPGAGGSRS
jgi:hypothetical protein